MSLPEKGLTALVNSNFKCKNQNCIYYGNKEWNGYCSQCFKDIDGKKKHQNITKKVQRSYSDAHETHNPFAKFEEKKKQHVDKKSKTFSRIMKRQSKENSNQSPSKDIEEHFGKELPLKDAALKDIAKRMQHQFDVMHKLAGKSIDEQAEAVQDFYNLMLTRIETQPYYSDLTSDQIDQLMDVVEEQLMKNLCNSVGQQVLSECEEKDLAIQKRIRELKWITADHLGLSIKENCKEVSELMDKAIADVVLSMNQTKAPQEKIKYIVDCSNSIINIINLSQGVTVSADEFLTVMVYIVLKANPPLLQSNIKYITSFSIPSRLRSGEGAYYFTHLCCAVAFIEDLTAESLKMSEEVFQRYMTGAIPLPSVDQSADFEGLRLMTRNLIALTEMEENNNLLNDMQETINDFAKLTETIRESKKISPLIIKPTPYTIPANTDMSLVPEGLRGRVEKAPTEDILVEIDFKPEPSQQPVSSNIKECLIQESSEKIDPGFCIMQPLQVLLPSKTIDPNLLNLQKKPRESSQPVINLKDLNYPTELFPDDPKSDEDNSVEFGPFESCDDMFERDNFADPLSPEASFTEENLNLPPPLLPVVVQTTNSNPDHNSDNLL